MGTKPFLAMPDVIRLWKEETGRTITRATVVKHLQRSKPADPATERPAGRHITDPFPTPGEGRDLWWHLNQESELRDWIRRHSTPGRPVRGRG